jgi:hypothetical protein
MCRVRLPKAKIAETAGKQRESNGSGLSHRKIAWKQRMAEEEKGSWAGSEWDQGVSLDDLQKEKSVKGQKKNLATAKYKDEDE